MKRMICLLAALMLMFGMLTCVASATEDAVAADGWSVVNDNYIGWTMDGGVITGNFNIGWENADPNPISLWKDLLTDENDFTLDLDMKAGGSDSPAISLLGVRIEADGNNGDGNQVYLKINNTEGFDGGNKTYDWLKAAGSKVHITIWRIAGGDLTIRITGESSASVIGETKTITVTPAATGPEVKLYVFRGCAEFGHITLSEGVSEVPEVTQPTQPKPTEPAATEPKPTEPEATEPKATDPAPTDPTQPKPATDDSVLWIVISAVAAVLIVVAVVVIIKKKKA